MTTLAREREGKSAVRLMFERAFGNADFSGIDRVLSPSAKLHFRGGVYEASPTAFKGIVDSWRIAFPDLRFAVDDLVAEDDRVAVRLTFEGTHLGAWQGFAPTGRRIAVSEMMFFRFEAGQIVELWEDYDELGMRRQLGIA